MAKAVDFKTSSSAPSVTPAPAIPAAAPAAKPAAEEEETASASESSTSETMPAATTMNEAPTVADINVAKVTLTGLKFGENKIEFSVPTDQTNKVAPMIGNMYLTSSDSDANKKKIYDDLFANTFNNENNPTAVTVDLLKGYSLAASYSIYVRQFNELNIQNGADMPKSPTVYLVGLIGSNASKSIRDLSNVRTSPNTVNANRTFTIYVNAPKSGDYYLSGSYLTNQNRNIKFLNSSSDETSNNSLALNVKAQTNW
ncbi:Mycoplasma haemagglutinin, partial [Mycoplasmoides gallisepticum]